MLPYGGCRVPIRYGLLQESALKSTFWKKTMLGTDRKSVHWVPVLIEERKVGTLPVHTSKFILSSPGERILRRKQMDIYSIG